MHNQEERLQELIDDQLIINKFSQSILQENEWDQLGEFVGGYCCLKGQLHMCKFNPLVILTISSSRQNK